MNYDDALDLPRDEDGRIVGYQVGKAAALSEWSFRKQKRDDAALFHRLASRNYARRRRAESPEVVREYQRTWRAANRAGVRARDRRRKRALSAKRRHLACRCGECGKLFTPKRYVEGTRWCSRKCSNAHHGRERTRQGKRNRGIRNMALVTQMTRALRLCPWLTLAELAAHLPDCKRTSIATKLTGLVQSGEVVHDGKRKGRRYALAEARRQEAA